MKFLRRYISLSLILILLVPSVIQLLHITFEQHNCVELMYSTEDHNIHDLDHDNCDLCDFHLNSFTINSITFSSAIVFIPTTSLEKYYYKIRNAVFQSTLLRGPPCLV
ncbi:hypothetical protein [Tenacibaculum sp. SZ-18]|uniref:hypothetical protein n=1 Tax=Tenacibaculum sp. SZ-18 TaxID=754423 RepID=UPI0012FD6242|nr:hypothetical protein [Tenacibaculum sp. SZ-18]